MRRQRAFTLVEVIIAMAILSLALVGIASMLAVGVMQQRDGANDTMGVLTGQNALAVLQASDHIHGSCFPPSMTPYDFEGPKATVPVHADDPTNTFDYKLMYRTPYNGQTEVAVFAYRTARGNNPVATESVYITTNANGVTTMSGAGLAGRPGQMILAVYKGTKTYLAGTTVVLRVIGENRLGSPVEDGNYDVYYLPQMATGIVSSYIQG